MEMNEKRLPHFPLCSILAISMNLCSSLALSRASPAVITHKVTVWDKLRCLDIEKRKINLFIFL